MAFVLTPEHFNSLFPELTLKAFAYRLQITQLITIIEKEGSHSLSPRSHTSFFKPWNDGLGLSSKGGPTNQMECDFGFISLLKHLVLLSAQERDR